MTSLTSLPHKEFLSLSFFAPAVSNAVNFLCDLLKCKNAGKNCSSAGFIFGILPFSSLRHLQDMLPYNDYFEYYGPDYRLHMPTSNMENMNKRETLEEVRFPVALLKKGSESATKFLIFIICAWGRGMLKVEKYFLRGTEGIRTHEHAGDSMYERLSCLRSAGSHWFCT